MVTNDIKYSRPAATALQLGDLAQDSHRFIDKQVLLTGESDILTTENGRQCMLASLSLLIRICRNVTVSLPDGNARLLAECRAIASELEFGNAVMFPEKPVDQSKFDAILCIGKQARADLPFTVINSNGWLARVSSGSISLQSDCVQSNPIASLAAACLGVSEVFKRLIVLKPKRGEFFNGLTFSLFNYSTGNSDCGPILPTSIYLDLLIVGAGAIGNGVAYLLKELPITGRVLLVDSQSYAEENLGTSILVGPKAIGEEKAKIMAQILHGSASVQWFAEDLSEFTKRLGNEVKYPQIAIGCLHDIEVRHQLQNLWPDIIFDGAIGDFACHVSLHPHDSNIACLMCFLRNQPAERTEVIASRETGLSIERSQQPSEIVTENDVLSAPKLKQNWLRTQVGNSVCSVIQAAQQLSEIQQRVGFQPSVPFVACLSASMVVTELVKYTSGWKSSLEPCFQIDILTGPAFGQFIQQERRKDCICVTRKKNIDLIRSRRVNQEKQNG
jgi:hypothetical protein